MLKDLLCLFLMLLSASCFGLDLPVLSSSSTISLLTCSPGEELYESFGHTAIRVKDDSLGIDQCYNYGTFNFNQPNFYVNFVKGRLLYTLSVSGTRAFTSYYARWNRQITEQVLNLSAREKQTLYNTLEVNALPENSDYLYDYFFDNCSTRPGDVILSSLDGELAYDSAYIANWSIRQLMNSYMGEDRAWGRLGINICLGARIDQPATAFEYHYLPDELMKGLDSMYVQLNGVEKPLVAAKQILVERQPTKVIVPWTTPKTILSACLMLIASIIFMGRIRNFNVRWLEGSVFLIVGLLSNIFLFLWFGTDHAAAKPNYSVIWALPTHIIFGIILFKKNRPIWVRWYAVATAISLALVLAMWKSLPQEFVSEVRFVIILLLFLCVSMIRAGARRPDQA